MKNKIYALTLVAGTILCCTANTQAAVTIEVETVGYGDENTDNVNDMAWGLLIDSSSGTFPSLVTDILAEQLLGFTPPPTATTSTPTQIGTSSLYFVRAESDTFAGPPPTYTNGYMDIARFGYTGPVDSGDALGLLWLPTGNAELQAGDSFGFQDLGTTVPSDGSTVNVSSSASPDRANFTVVPEPSAALLALLGGLALFLRRRR